VPGNVTSPDLHSICVVGGTGAEGGGLALRRTAPWGADRAHHRSSTSFPVARDTQTSRVWTRSSTRSARSRWIGSPAT